MAGQAPLAVGASFICMNVETRTAVRSVIAGRLFFFLKAASRLDAGGNMSPFMAEAMAGKSSDYSIPSYPIVRSERRSMAGSEFGAQSDGASVGAS